MGFNSGFKGLKLNQSYRVFTRRPAYIYVTSIYVTSIYDGDRLKFKVPNEAREKNNDIRISSFTRQLQEIRHLALYEIRTGNTTSPFTTEIQEIQYLDRYEVSAGIMQQ